MIITSKCMSFTADNIYGEYNHALSKNELPQHDHMVRHYLQGNAEWNGAIHDNTVVVTHYGAFFPDSTNGIGSTGYTTKETNNVYLLDGAHTSSAGGNESHNNIQPSIVTFFWKRVS